MANTWQHLSNQATTCHAEDVAIHAKWQIDGNVFCFNIYIYRLDCQQQPSRQARWIGMFKVNLSSVHYKECRLLMQELTVQETSLSCVGALVEELKLLSHLFFSCILTSCPKSCNRAASCLALRDKLYVSCKIWMESLHSQHSCAQLLIY
jgi:hypothetical protein